MSKITNSRSCVSKTCLKSVYGNWADAFPDVFTVIVSSEKMTCMSALSAAKSARSLPRKYLSEPPARRGHAACGRAGMPGRRSNIGRPDTRIAISSGSPSTAERKKIPANRLQIPSVFGKYRQSSTTPAPRHSPPAMDSRSESGVRKAVGSNRDAMIQLTSPRICPFRRRLARSAAGVFFVRFSRSVAAHNLGQTARETNSIRTSKA